MRRDTVPVVEAMVDAPSGRDLTVRPVEGRRDLNRFVKLPYRLHRDEPAWVPPLIFERRQFLDKRKNPYLKRAEAELFLCEREGEVVGRIAAHIDPRYDELHGGRDGMFGFFDSVDDPDVAQALVATAAEWLAGRGRDRMLGPLDFTTNDECGLLVDGHDVHPMILQPWHPPHYLPLLEGAGLRKEVDLFSYRLELGLLHEGEHFHPAIHQMAERVETDHGITIRNMRKRDLQAEIWRFVEVYNEAWKDNWGFVPIDESEARFYARNLKPVLEEHWTFIAERDSEVLGAALSLPDVNRALKPMRGRILPFGWLRFLRARRSIDEIRVFALGVKPSYQHTGIAAAFYVRHLETGPPIGISSGEMGWILETNEAMNRAMEGMGGQVVKRYRILERSL